MLNPGRVPLPVGRAGFKPPRNNAESMWFLANGGPRADWISMGYHPLWKNGLAPLLRPSARHRNLLSTPHSGGVGSGPPRRVRFWPGFRGWPPGKSGRPGTAKHFPLASSSAETLRSIFGVGRMPAESPCAVSYRGDAAGHVCGGSSSSTMSTLGMTKVTVLRRDFMHTSSFQNESLKISSLSSISKKDTDFGATFTYEKKVT
jgi:hypothetical protein